MRGNQPYYSIIPGLSIKTDIEYLTSGHDGSVYKISFKQKDLESKSVELNLAVPITGSKKPSQQISDTSIILKLSDESCE